MVVVVTVIMVVMAVTVGVVGLIVQRIIVVRVSTEVSSSAHVLVLVVGVDNLLGREGLLSHDAVNSGSGKTSAQHFFNHGLRRFCNDKRPCPHRNDQNQSLRTDVF